jgi:hypothetical protein
MSINQHDTWLEMSGPVAPEPLNACRQGDASIRCRCGLSGASKPHGFGPHDFSRNPFIRPSGSPLQEHFATGLDKRHVRLASPFCGCMQQLCIAGVETQGAEPGIVR